MHRPGPCGCQRASNTEADAGTTADAAVTANDSTAANDNLPETDHNDQQPTKDGAADEADVAATPTPTTRISHPPRTRPQMKQTQPLAPRFSDTTKSRQCFVPIS